MAKYVIEAEKEIEHICDWIKKYFVDNGPNSKAVIGMSGGKDSNIIAALLRKGLGPERVYGVIMPDGEMKDKHIAIEVCKDLGIKYEICDIHKAVEGIYDAIGKDYVNDTVKTNTPARIRMTTLYAIAANVGGRVVNTCNKSEDYIGWSTKYGDLAGDFSVLQDYPVRWVKEIGYCLVEQGIIGDKSWVDKIPDDGMCGQSDEDKFGFTYETLDALLIDGIVPTYDVYSTIMKMHNNNAHKEAIRLPKPRVETKHRYGDRYEEKEDFWF